MNILLSAEINVEARLGYAQFIDKSVQTIYGPGAPDVEVEASLVANPCLAFWANANCIWKTGSSSGKNDETDFNMQTFSMGFKMLFLGFFSKSQLDLGLGIGGARLYIEENIYPHLEQRDRWTVGAVGKLGLHVYFKDNVFLSPFLDYYYLPFESGEEAAITTGNIVNLGGFRMGLGLGYQF